MKLNFSSYFRERCEKYSQSHRGNFCCKERDLLSEILKLGRLRKSEKTQLFLRFNRCLQKLCFFLIEKNTTKKSGFNDFQLFVKIEIIRINFIYIFIQLPSFRKIPKKVVLKQNTKFDIAEKEKS